MKKGRQEVIIELIRNEVIHNQNELVSRLNSMGFNVTQATVSRDITNLGIIKVKSNDGFKYAVVENPDNHSEKYIRIISDTLKKLDVAKNILVVKTQSGMAMATAAAFDGLKFDEIIGTIAGDDSIFIATNSDEKAILLKNKIEVLINKENNVK